MRVLFIGAAVFLGLFGGCTAAQQQQVTDALVAAEAYQRTDVPPSPVEDGPIEGVADVVPPPPADAPNATTVLTAECKTAHVVLANWPANVHFSVSFGGQPPFGGLTRADGSYDHVFTRNDTGPTDLVVFRPDNGWTQTLHVNNCPVPTPPPCG